jgi:hypothetical protein
MADADVNRREGGEDEPSGRTGLGGGAGRLDELVVR